MPKYPFRVDSTFTRVWEVGDSDRVVVLVHDAALRADWWRQNLKDLAAGGVRAVSFDLPGHGFAEKAADQDHSISGYARFLRQFIDGMGLLRPILVGAGVGAHVAAHLACAMPTRIAGLVLSSPTGIAPLSTRDVAALRKTLDDTSFDGARARVRAMLAERWDSDMEWIREEHRINVSPGAPEAFAALSVYVGERLELDNVRAGLSALVGSVPTLLVWGEKDPLLPVSLAATARTLLGNVAVTVIRDAGHAPYYDRPKAFDAALIGFATEVLE